MGIHRFSSQEFRVSGLKVMNRFMLCFVFVFWGAYGILMYRVCLGLCQDFTMGVWGCVGLHLHIPHTLHPQVLESYRLNP